MSEFAPARETRPEDDELPEDEEELPDEELEDELPDDELEPLSPEAADSCNIRLPSPTLLTSNPFNHIPTTICLSTIF